VGVTEGYMILTMIKRYVIRNRDSQQLVYTRLPDGTPIYTNDIGIAKKFTTIAKAELYRPVGCNVWSTFRK